MSTLPTVKIDDGAGGFIVINESDFDADKHTKHGEKQAAKRRKPAPAIGESDEG